jgi:hypothetical protein
MIKMGATKIEALPLYYAQLHATVTTGESLSRCTVDSWAGNKCLPCLLADRRSVFTAGVSCYALCSKMYSVTVNYLYHIYGRGLSDTVVTA